MKSMWGLITLSVLCHFIAGDKLYAFDCLPTEAKEGNEADAIEQEYSPMFFQIFADESIPPIGEVKAIGTATLIDSRGFFITAAHVLERQDYWGPTKNLSWD